jgi:threonine dehydrogenase-like Zn-dependent dehydrogenase
MKAIVFHGVGDVRLDTVSDPKIQHPLDAIIRITASAICGTDLHFIRGTVPGMKKGRVLGHEALGIIEELGKEVRNLKVGDRVVVPSTVGCGSCNYCRAGYFAQCDKSNPGGPLAGTVFFGGPESAGGLDGLQAEYARIPFANAGLLKLPDDVDNDRAILLSDILPTSYMAAEMAEIKPSNMVAIFGCGPVGQLAIACAQHLGAGRIFAIDSVPSRLEMARSQGAETIAYDKEDVVEVLRDLTNGSGPDRVIDAVGVDAASSHPDSAAKKEFKQEMKTVAPDARSGGEDWSTGGAPSQALEWAVESVAKAGTVSIIGVYPQTLKNFPIGDAMNKNLTIKSGNCNHRRYLPKLIELVRTGAIRTEKFLTQDEPLTSAIEAYKAFDRHASGWIKVKLETGALEKTGRDAAA